MALLAGRFTLPRLTGHIDDEGKRATFAALDQLMRPDMRGENPSMTQLRDHLWPCPNRGARSSADVVAARRAEAAEWHTDSAPHGEQSGRPSCRCPHRQRAPQGMPWALDPSACRYRPEVRAAQIYDPRIACTTDPKSTCRNIVD